MNLNALDARLRKAEDEAARLRGEVPDLEGERERLRLIVPAQRHVLAMLEAEAAKPYSERGQGISPESTRRRMCGDEALASQLAEQRERLAVDEGRLAELEGRAQPE